MQVPVGGDCRRSAGDARPAGGAALGGVFLLGLLPLAVAFATTVQRRYKYTLTRYVLSVATLNTCEVSTSAVASHVLFVFQVLGPYMHRNVENIVAKP